jgi:hypothetical protein
MEAMKERRKSKKALRKAKKQREQDVIMAAAQRQRLAVKLVIKLKKMARRRIRAAAMREVESLHTQYPKEYWARLKELAEVKGTKKGTCAPAKPRLVPWEAASCRLPMAYHYLKLYSGT